MRWPQAATSKVLYSVNKANVVTMDEALASSCIKLLGVCVSSNAKEAETDKQPAKTVSQRVDAGSPPCACQLPVDNIDSVTRKGEEEDDGGGR